MISEEEIKKAAIKNAAMHQGAARIGSVISEILGKDKQLVKEMDKLKVLAEKAVNEVNSLSKEEIMKLADEMKLVSNNQNEKEKKGLKPLPGAEKGVVLRLPPEPSGYMHWGHALSFTINYLYKECTCSSEEIKKNRNSGKECQHRNNSIDENLSLWEKAKEGKFETGELTFRFKGNMNDKDASLRDPNIMRVIKTDYKPYNLWPLYDFASVIEDELCGITHILRSNEFKANLQTRLRKELGFHEPYVIQYSRFNFEGTLTSKRKVRELIKQGYIKDWHDIRLATIYSMKRRGIEPQAIREFVKEVGYSSSEHEYSLDMLFTFNRRIIDGKAAFPSIE